MSEILREFKSPLIRKAISHAWPESFPAGFLFSTLAWMNESSAGYPLGGSLEFSKSIDVEGRALVTESGPDCRIEKVGSW